MAPVQQLLVPRAAHPPCRPRRRGRRPRGPSGERAVRGIRPSSFGDSGPVDSAHHSGPDSGPCVPWDPRGASPSPPFLRWPRKNGSGGVEAGLRAGLAGVERVAVVEVGVEAVAQAAAAVPLAQEVQASGGAGGGRFKGRAAVYRYGGRRWWILWRGCGGGLASTGSCCNAGPNVCGHVSHAFSLRPPCSPFVMAPP